MTRDSRARIAQETVSISKRGCYIFNGVEKRLTPDDLYLLWEPFDMDGMCIDSIEHEGLYAGEIFLHSESVIDTIFNLQSRSIDGNKVGVLSFASAKNPGGGFLNGSMAQEEALAYCSNLYESIKDSDLYAINARCKSTTYTDTAITCRVSFFRTSDFELVDIPYDVNIVTCPAVNMSRVRPDMIDEAKRVMVDRMSKIIALMINRGYEYIILGAYGCGVFRNDPKDIASTWHYLLVERNLRTYFKEIYFSIYEVPPDRNTREFSRVFGTI